MTKQIIGFSGKQWVIKPNYIDFFSNKCVTKPICYKEILMTPQKNFYKVVNIIVRAIQTRQKIGILGDYDVDGVCSTSIFVKFLNQVADNIEYEAVIPHRLLDGYGPSQGIVDYLLKKPTKHAYKSVYRGDLTKPANVIIFLDSGTTAHDIIQYIHQNGVAVIVIDHHAIDQSIPKNCFFINSKQWTDQEYEYLCATGLTFMILHQCNKYFKNKVDLDKMVDLVALATICDCVELTSLNNSIVQAGLNQLNSQPSSGLQSLITYSEKITDFYTHKDLGFFFGPIINAFGRMEHAIEALELITTQCDLNQKKLALKGLLLNQYRKNQQTNIISNIIYQLSDTVPDFICLADVLENYQTDQLWSFGIIGVIAGQLKERFGKPVALFSHLCVDNHNNHKNCLLKGSFRSPTWFPVDQFIQQLKQREIILNGGGHICAGGCTLEVQNWSKLYNLFCEQVTNLLQEEIPKETLNIECTTSVFALQNQKTYCKIQQLLPFGPRKPQPLFQLLNYKLVLQVRRPKGIIYNICNPLEPQDSINVYMHHTNHLISYVKNQSTYHFVVTPNLYKSKVCLEIIDCIEVI